jgi:hypothetical protein
MIELIKLFYDECITETKNICIEIEKKPKKKASMTKQQIKS